uniref:NADH-quinone oxidoreductase subunit J n=1 Tax=Candidatus Aschnera chinzeii TaxID=1485666 RepID=A0AAT9G4C0_9ENTR|nr:MAG: NADH-quinone oxidoreductase subunit J [Candidatus Aschnera chinzeii]
MNYIFYISGMIAIITTYKAITHTNPIYALLYLLIFILSISSIFFSLGAYFAGSIEIIIYAGAIMVLFIFVIMTLNLGQIIIKEDHKTLKQIKWLLPLIILIGLSSLLIYSFFSKNNIFFETAIINIKEIGIKLFTTYIIAVELCSILLLSGLIVAIHHGKIYQQTIKSQVNKKT